MTDLLDLLATIELAGDPRADLVHVCLPSMGFVCGGTSLGLADGGPAGHWKLGANATDWPTVTCPECRAPGRREISRTCHRQQAPVGHVCLAPNETDDIRCLHWQSIGIDGS